MTESGSFVVYNSGSDNDVAPWMIGAASTIGIFLVTLLYGHTYQGYPYPQLGRRPLGNGLFSYLKRYYRDGTGVFGYDPILGAFAPPLRMLFHLVAAMVVGSLALCLWPNDSWSHGVPFSSFVAGFSSSSCGGLLLPFVLVLAIYVFLQVMVLQKHFLSVSYPGGPRPHKIQRKPQWENKVTHLPATTSSPWRCVVGEESKQVSATKFQGTAAEITGEITGRQIWTNTTAASEEASDNSVCEKLVEELASGGRQSTGFNPASNPNSADQVFRKQQIRDYLRQSGHEAPDTKQKAKTVQEALEKGAHFYSMLQTTDGHWGGDFGGPHFLLPGLIIVWYIMGKPSLMLDNDAVQLMKHYILVHQQIDGGWGTHFESPSTMFGTTLMYVALRLLGVHTGDPAAVKGRAFIREQGGAVMTSSWAKFYLCLLGVMDWRGHNSVPPETLLLPNWFPCHPGRMWCHARMVYLPMSYLYSRRYTYKDADSDLLTLSLRKELYLEEDYEFFSWTSTRHLVAPMDKSSPIPWTMKLLQNMLALYETWSIFRPFRDFLRGRHANPFCIDYMAAEDSQTNSLDIGPVSKVLNMLSFFDTAKGNLNDPKVMNHMLRMQDFLWLAEDGMKMQGYNGSQCWDTSFAVQAYYEAGMLDQFPDVSKRAWKFLEKKSQIHCSKAARASPAFKYESAPYRKQFYRHVSEGGWPFSTSVHGWPVSDSTAEGLKAVLCLQKCSSVAAAVEDKTLSPIDIERLEKAVNVILLLQNEDGGWATYENNRGFGWYESLNPSEAFGDIMIDYSYAECSMAYLTALHEFHKRYPKVHNEEVQHALSIGRGFLKRLQRDNGSWYGSWACCFCYGTWFGVEGLVSSGEDPLQSSNIQKAREFLLKHQRSNGGWGEDFTSCYDKSYAGYAADGMQAYGDDGSSVISTAWALMALSCAKCSDKDAVRRGVKNLMKRQLPCGDWPQEGISGVFNRSCGITYAQYRSIFPLWAMGRCRSVYGDELLDQ